MRVSKVRKAERVNRVCALCPDSPKGMATLGTLHTSHRTSPAYHTDTSGSGVREVVSGLRSEVGKSPGRGSAHLGSAQQKQPKLERQR